MNTPLAYLFSTFAFAGGSAVFLFLLAPRRIWRERRAIGITMLAGVCYAPVEFFALRWNIWEYAPERRSGVSLLGIPLETYFFGLMIALVLAEAAAIFQGRSSQPRAKPHA